MASENGTGLGKRRREGLALCLSGGGYRAMLFHAGALTRLNELRLLPRLDFVSSVSGGSLAAGVLAACWHRLEFVGDVALNFELAFVEPVTAFSRRLVDIPCILKGVLSPWSTAAAEVAKAYDQNLFNGVSLQDLPDRPRFVFCASNLSTGSVFRFSKRYMADYRLGQILAPNVPLATAVAASSAFPPFLSPLRLDLQRQNFANAPKLTGKWAGLRSRAVLTDGGVYDNHGLEPVIKRCRTVLVSDGGAPWQPSLSSFANWYAQIKRVSYTTDNQVRSLRRRDLIERFLLSAEADRLGLDDDAPLRRDATLRGAYWSLVSDPAEYPAEQPIRLDEARRHRLAEVGTRLTSLGEQAIADLVNWGYLAADFAIRSHYDRSLPRPVELPLKDVGHQAT